MNGDRSPADLASLFGLSAEETRSLGVAEPAEAHHLDKRSSESGASVSAAQPDHESASATPSLALDLLSVFNEEAAELLDSLHTALETLEGGPSEAAVFEARRTVHTLKGGARVCGLPAVSDLAHACEDAIGPALDGTHELPEVLITLLFQAEQELREAIANPSDYQARERMGDLASCLRSISPQPDPPHADEPFSSGLRDADDQDAAPTFTHKARSSLLRRPNISTVAPQNNRMAVDAGKVEGIVAKVTEIVSNRAVSHNLMEELSSTIVESMRSVQRLQSIAAQLHFQIVSQGLDMTVEQGPDDLEMESYGPIHQLLLQLQEAVGDQQALVQATMDAVTSRKALAAVETRLDADLQGALLHMRLLPLGQLRVRLDQVVRSAAAVARREVHWVMEGQDVALDKQVTDRLFEPLMHLLRNAVDHGIEPPEERAAAGKPRVGALAVRAVVEGNQALITISDDGRGLNPAHLAAVAVARGIVSAEQARLMPEREKLELIFRPGFSTASAITELSGRGMGMDIVKETCTRLGGSLTVSSQIGYGTSVTLQVPLSMSILHALIVRDGGTNLVIPASHVHSVQLVAASAVYEQDGHQWIHLGRDDLPMYQLSRQPGVSLEPVESTADERIVLIVPYHDGFAVLAIDELLNEEDVTVKPLPVLMQGVNRLLGAVILVDGTPAPVINVPPMLDWMEQRARSIEPTVRLSFPEEQTVLIVDDSLTIRYALTQTLERAGLRVVTARDGREAIEAVRTYGVPRLITLDIEMPRMDGLETLYAIRHTLGAEHIPIFVLTSRSGQQHHRTAMQLGATRYFTKPYQDGDLLRAVQEALGMPIRAAG